MGTLSEQLKLLNAQLGYAKESINGKYNTMDMPSIETLKVKELSTKIDDIPVLNTKDATAEPSDILKDKTAYINHTKVTGEMNNLNSDIIDLDVSNINNLEFKIKNLDGYVGPNTVFKVDKNTFVNQLGIVSNIIKKGESILDIQGEYAGLETTNDATATSSDIIKNKTAYVNGQKITGSLLDYSNTTVNTTAKLVGSDIKITLPTKAVYDNLSTISISLKSVANLINLTSDKIKNGEEVLGIIGSYTKPSEPDDNIPPEEDGNYVNYETRENFFHFNFKWGYRELSQLPSGQKSTQKTRLYTRFYNAYYYNGECEGYYVNDDKDTIYAPTYNHSKIEYALSCYVHDLNLTPEECNDVWMKVFYDSPELLAKFDTYYYSKENGIVKYIFLDSLKVSLMKEFKNTCLKTFNEISNIVKSTYGITYKGGSSWDNSVETDVYSVQEKVKIAKVIHDFLVLNNVYGYSTYDQIMYPALSKGKCTPVCASYGKAFQWCCQKYGIFALVIVGDAGGSHLWNMVCYEKYDNYVVNAYNNPSVWNEVDVTWDDPSNVIKCRWEFFNTTTAYMKTNAGGNRVRGRMGITNFNNECYYDHISECSCTKYTYNGSTNYGGL